MPLLEFYLRCRGFTPPDALLGLMIKGLCLSRGSAQFRQVSNSYRPFVRSTADGELVASTYDVARFRAAAVDFDLAAVDRLSGEPASLEKSRGPEPLVDSELWQRKVCDHGLRPVKLRQATVLQKIIVGQIDL